MQIAGFKITAEEAREYRARLAAGGTLTTEEGANLLETLEGAVSQLVDLMETMLPLSVGVVGMGHFAEGVKAYETLIKYLPEATK